MYGFQITRNTGSVELSRNRIYNIDKTAPSIGNFIGIRVDGEDPGSMINITNNMVSIVPTGSSSVAISAVFDQTTAGTINVHHNSFLVGGVSTGGETWASLPPTASTATGSSLTTSSLREPAVM